MYKSKTIIVALVLIVITFSECGNNNGKVTGVAGSQPAQNGTAAIVFKEYDHDFGKVAEGEKVSYIFIFENRGTANLVVNSAATSCGCTVPKYDTKPVLPGGKGDLEVVFDTSGRNGMQTKTITVKSNASTPVVLLKITAEVVSTNN
jgi:hypothetical protein